MAQFCHVGQGDPPLGVPAVTSRATGGDEGTRSIIHRLTSPPIEWATMSSVVPDAAVIPALLSAAANRRSTAAGRRRSGRRRRRRSSVGEADHRVIASPCPPPQPGAPGAGLRSRALRSETSSGSVTIRSTVAYALARTVLVIGLDGTDYLPVGYDSWPVDDERTRVSMTHFYRMLGERLASGGWIWWETPSSA